MSDLRAELGRLFRIESKRAEYCVQCGLPRDQDVADCKWKHEMLLGVDLAEPHSHAERLRLRTIALYYSASTPEEIGELLRMRGMHGFAEHVELLCRASGPMHEVLRRHAEHLATGKMLGGAWLSGPWTNAEAIRALRWAADRIEAHPVRPVGWDDSTLPKEAQRPNRWHGNRSGNRRRY